MQKVPARKLSPEAQDWGRWVENKIKELDTSTLRALQDNTNALKGVNSAVSALSGQVAALAQITSDLAATQDDLAAQQNELNEQQTYLASLVSRDDGSGYRLIDDLVSNNQWQWEQAASVTINVTTGKLRIFLRTDKATAYSTSALITAGITYSVSGGVLSAGSALMTTDDAGIGDRGNYKGGGLMRVGTLVMEPGVYTVRGYAGGKLNTGHDGSYCYVGFNNFSMIAEVVNND